MRVGVTGARPGEGFPPRPVQHSDEDVLAVKLTQAPAATAEALTGRAQKTTNPSDSPAMKADAAQNSRCDTSVDGDESSALLALAESAGISLWHTTDEKAFASVTEGEAEEHLEVRSNAFREWLTLRYYRAMGSVPRSNVLSEALRVLGARARFDGERHAAHVRMAEHRGMYYIDLVDAQRHVVEVSPSGWSIVQNSPVKFLRKRGMVALPQPVRGGDIEGLRRFVNVADDSDWALIISWLVAALSPRGPYPVLCLNGEQGSAKSTLCRLLRDLVDPSTAALRTEPSSDRDLMIAARNTWVMVLDNLSQLARWLSDALCRLATGGGLSTRELYTDDSEVLFDAKRPVILNGITEVASRPDLADRAICITLPRIPEHQRMTEAELTRDFASVRGKILGALLDAVAAGMRNEAATRERMKHLPRMADFAVWAAACLPAMGLEPDAFLTAYARSRQHAASGALEEPVAEAIMNLVENLDSWQGTASELLRELNDPRFKQQGASGDWPRSSRMLSGILRRLGPVLRDEAGIDVEFLPRKNNRRPIRIRRIPSRPSHGHVRPPAEVENADPESGAHSPRDDHCHPDGHRGCPVPGSETSIGDGRDGRDGPIAVSSRQLRTGVIKGGLTVRD